MSEPYWFSIEDAGAVHGGAFVFARKYALTATHCLPAGYESAETSDTPSEVWLVSENGTRIHATVAETIGDLALLDLRGFGKHHINPPHIQEDVVDKDSLWEAPYRPSLQHPMLTGVVGNPNLSFLAVDGTQVSALQLTVSEGVGDHSGYSGGPVVTKGTDVTPPVILGMLIEQFPDQADRKRSANVLFAARLMQIWNFVAFEFDRRLLNRSSERTVRDTRQVLDRAKEMLLDAREWADARLVDDHEYRDMKARVRDFVFTEESAGRSK